MPIIYKNTKIQITGVTGVLSKERFSRVRPKKETIYQILHSLLVIDAYNLEEEDLTSSVMVLKGTICSFSLEVV